MIPTSTINPHNNAGYSHPLFNISDLYEPKSIKEIFNFSKIICTQNDIVAPIMSKLSEAPLTGFDIQHEDLDVVKTWERLIVEDLDLPTVFLGILFDLFGYSNAFATIETKLKRYLIPKSGSYNKKNVNSMSEKDFNSYLKSILSPSVGDDPIVKYDISSIESLGLNPNGDGFRGRDPFSGKDTEFVVIDRYYKSPKTIYIKRWDPNGIDITYNEITDSYKYFYKMRGSTAELIKRCDREIISDMPWEIIEAALKDRNIVFKDGKMSHFRNVNISGVFPGWGIPRVYSAFKLIFYYMTLMGANQATAAGKINDLEILFPAVGGMGGQMDPVAAVGGYGQITRRLQTILNAHKKDKNFRGISPIPISKVNIGGEGRMQLISGEIEPITRSICTIIGAPYDLFYGGSAYQAQAAASRLYSAQVSLIRTRVDDFLKGMVRQISSELGSIYKSNVTIKLKDEGGPDALETKKTILSMSDVVSATSRLKNVGLDYDTEYKLRVKEARKEAEIRVIAAVADGKAQALGQEMSARVQESGETGSVITNGGPQQGGNDMVSKVVNFINQNPDNKDEILSKIKKTDINLYKSVVSSLGGTPSGDAPYLDAPDAGTVSMPESRPMPEILPPRRETGGV